MSTQGREKVTAWVTKYALSSGIIVADGHIIDDMFFFGFLSGGVWGNDWHRTPEAAIARAEEMRNKKIESLKEQIAKLEKMTFSIPEKDEV